MLVSFFIAFSYILLVLERASNVLLLTERKKDEQSSAPGGETFSFFAINMEHMALPRVYTFFFPTYVCLWCVATRWPLAVAIREVLHRCFWRGTVVKQPFFLWTRFSTT